MPYSGPAAAYSVMGRTQAAYFDKINAEGGVKGRKLTFISYDDAYQPQKTIAQARRLVESDQVLLIFSSLGTPTNAAIRQYMNEKRVPQLFVASGASMWRDPQRFPWTIGFQPSYRCEGRIYAQYITKNHSHGKVGILCQNDEYGRDYLCGFKEGLAKEVPIVAEASYESSDTTIERQVVGLRDSGADILFSVTTPKFAAEAIRRIAEIGWNPIHLLNEVSASIGGVFAPAGLRNAVGILSTAFFKDPGDPSWRGDAGYKEWAMFMDKYHPTGNRLDANTVYGYLTAQTLVHVLEQCGECLTRENVMIQATALKDLALGMLLPGIRLKGVAFAPISELQMVRFNGEHWEHFGPIMSPMSE